MLVLIDESGDSGLKTEQGSSRFFTIGLVVFEDHDEAQAVDFYGSNRRLNFLSGIFLWETGPTEKCRTEK